MALNDVIMVFAFAPFVALLLGLSAITVPWQTLLLSVGLYIVIPVILAQIIRRRTMARGGQPQLDALLERIQPVSLCALLATLVLLFCFQGEQIIGQPLIIVMLAVPILIQVYFNSGLAYLLNRAAGEAHEVAGPSALSEREPWVVQRGLALTAIQVAMVTPFSNPRQIHLSCQPSSGCCSA